MPRFKINKSLLGIKAHYFLWNAGTAPVVPFMSVYARQLGFSSVAVGLIYTVSPLTIMLIKPITGAIADKFKCQNLIFIISHLIIIVSTIGLIFLPSYSENENLNKNVKSCTAEDFALNIETYNFSLCEFNCSTNRKTFSFTKCFKTVPNDFKPFLNESLTSCNINCQIAENTIRSLIKSNENDVYNTYQFWLLYFVFLLNAIGLGITIIFGDAICFNILGDAAYKFGYQRMFGALGWGTFSIGIGFLIDATSSETEKNYTPAFLVGTVTMILCLIVSARLKYTQHRVSKNIFKDVTRVLLDIRIIVFILWCLFLGTCTTLVRNYLFWLLDDLAIKNGNEENIKTIQGILMGVRCLGGELPFFFISSWLLKRVKTIHLMNLILLATGVRVLLYSILSNPWWCIPVELLNGLTFGIYYSTMTSYANLIAPPGTKTTTQGLVGAIHEGAGVSLGALIGGLLYDDYGGSMTFRIFGYASLVVFALHVIAHLLIEKFVKKDEETSDSIQTIMK